MLVNTSARQDKIIIGQRTFDSSVQDHVFSEGTTLGLFLEGTEGTEMRAQICFNPLLAGGLKGSYLYEGS